MDGVIQEINHGGDSSIPVDGYVASFGPRASAGALQGIAPGSEIKVGLLISGAETTIHERWIQLPEVLGGTPVLLIEGEPPDDMATERVRPSFIQERHPRTAVCIKPNGHWLLVVVDGRQPKLSQGMSLAALTTLLKAEGCHSALNLDGGGSTTLVIDNKLRSSPSDFGVERPVSDALLVLFREP